MPVESAITEKSKRLITALLLLIFGIGVREIITKWVERSRFPHAHNIVYVLMILIPLVVFVVSDVEDSIF